MSLLAATDGFREPNPPQHLEAAGRTAAEAEGMLLQLASALFPGGEHRLEQLTWERPGDEPTATAARLRAAEERYRILVEQIPP